MIQTYDLWEGTLTLGEAGTALAVSSQVTECKITPSEQVQTREAVPVLSGEEIPESSSATFSYVLAGTFLQSLAVGGVIDWTWANAGSKQPFEFVPAASEGRKINGIINVVPLEIGGAVAKPGAAAPLDTGFSFRGEGPLPDLGMA